VGGVYLQQPLCSVTSSKIAFEHIIAAVDAKCSKVFANGARVTVPVLPDHIQLVGFFCNHCEGIHCLSNHSSETPRACEVPSGKHGEGSRRGFVHRRAWCTIGIAVGDFFSARGVITAGAVQQQVETSAQPGSTVL
jgi:hypothetical protein